MEQMLVVSYYNGVLMPYLAFSVAFTGEQSGPSVVQNEVQATTVAQPAIPPAGATAATTSRKPQATPAVRRIASEHNVRKNLTQSNIDREDLRTTYVTGGYQ